MYKKKIARIRSQDYLNPKFTRVYNKENLQIDVIISPEIEIAKSIQRKLEAPGALDSVPFVDNQIRLLEILIKDNCKSINIKFNELTKKYPKLEENIIGINREEKFFIPKKTDSVKKDDKIYVIINSSQMAETLKAFGHEEKISKKILIIGSNGYLGKPLKNIKGELVCKNPFPSMPLKFWNDNNENKFKDAYFNRFVNVWHHGDFAEIKKTKGFVIHGRSDTTLNPGGVRLGTAEIYSEVEKFKEIKESIVVGQSWDNDVRIILFIVMNAKFFLTEDLLKKIKTQIRKNASPRHVPSKVIVVSDIPRTKSGKIVELAVKNTIEGNNIKNKEALANPKVLEQFKNLKELSV